MKASCLVLAYSVALSSCVPVKVSPRATGVVLNARTKKPVEGVAVSARRYESDDYRKKSETVQDGVFSIAATWTITPIPYFYFWPTRQLKFSHDGYKDYSMVIDENPPKGLRRKTVSPEGLTIELEPNHT